MRSQMMPTYSPPENMEVSHGEGIYLYTADGQKYIDCVSGIAVNCFGHANPELVKVLKKQAERLWHVSNMFRVPEAEKLAQTLVDHSFGDHVFFANSGGEAVEAAVKAARRYHHCKGHPERKRIVAFESCFHGRTTMTVAVTGNKAHMEGFFNGDLDCDHVPFEDMNALKAVVSKEKTAAIILEPVQGEGGVRPFTNEFIKAVRELCDETGTLLIFDEVQCGVGRTGTLFAYEQTGVTPDLMSLAKGLGGGFPIGACIATQEVGQHMTFGTHGTTFGGNPMACAVGQKVLDMILAPGFLDGLKSVAAYFQGKLDDLCKDFPQVFSGWSGKGLMLGLACVPENTQLLTLARDHGLLVAKSGGNKIRFLPPLNMSTDEVDQVVATLRDCCAKVK